MIVLVYIVGAVCSWPIFARGAIRSVVEANEPDGFDYTIGAGIGLILAAMWPIVWPTVGMAAVLRRERDDTNTDEPIEWP